MDIVSWFEKAGFEIDPTSTGGLKIMTHPEGMRISIVTISSYVSLYNGKDCIMAGKMHDPRFKNFKQIK